MIKNKAGKKTDKRAEKKNAAKAARKARAAKAAKAARTERAAQAIEDSHSVLGPPRGLGLPNKAIMAHGRVDHEHFAVVPDGVRVALVGTVGTLTEIVTGATVDLNRPEFMTWYLPGDIMPYITITVMRTFANVGGITPTELEFERESAHGSVPFIDTFRSFRGTVYLLCCLRFSPPEFSPVKDSRRYISRLYRYAPDLSSRGVVPGPRDILLQTSMHEDSARWALGTVMVHPVLTPDLFGSIFVRGEKAGSAVCMWIRDQDVWTVQGNSEAFIDIARMYSDTGIRLTPARTPFVPGRTTRRGFGILYVPLAVWDCEKVEKGVMLTTRMATNKTLSHPVWCAWEVEPVRGGGLEIPAARAAAASGKVFVGKMSALRGGKNVPWVPHMADMFQDGRDWAQRRHSIFSFGRR